MSAFDVAISVGKAPPTSGVKMPCELNEVSISNTGNVLLQLDKELKILKRDIAITKSRGESFRPAIERHNVLTDYSNRVKNVLQVSLKSNSEKLLAQKLQKDFVVFLTELTSVVKDLESVTDERKSQIVRPSFNVQASEDPSRISSIQLTEMMDDNSVDDLIAEERLREAEEIATKAVQLNALFSDVANLVKEQQVEIDQVAQNVDNAEAATKDGKEQLLQAEHHQKASGSCMMYMIGFLVIVSKIYLLHSNTNHFLYILYILSIQGAIVAVIVVLLKEK